MGNRDGNRFLLLWSNLVLVVSVVSLIADEYDKAVYYLGVGILFRLFWQESRD